MVRYDKYHCIPCRRVDQVDCVMCESDQNHTIIIMSTASTSPTSSRGLALCIRVAVGSKNPCKIEAVRKSFEDVFRNSKIDDDEKPAQIVISSYNVPSGKVRIC